MGRHVWSDEKKAEAVALLADPENSYYDVAKATGVPASTLHDWAQQNGLIGHTDRVEQTEAARKARMERIANKRSVLAEKFLDASESFIDHGVDVASGVIEVKEGVFLSGGRDAEALQRAAKGALESFRLEMGEATEVHENRGEGAVDVARAKLDELAERRAEKTA